MVKNLDLTMVQAVICWIFLTLVFDLSQEIDTHVLIVFCDGRFFYRPTDFFLAMLHFFHRCE